MVAWLASINLLVLVFNLLPAFPMDGGRIVRAIAWWRTGDRTAATRFAANLGRVFAYIFIAGGLLLVANGDVFAGIWLALIGMVINGSARGAAMQTAITGRIGDAPRRRRDGPRAGRDPGEISVEQALDEYFLRYRWPWFPVVDAAHRFLGLLGATAPTRSPRSRAPSSHRLRPARARRRPLQIRDDAPLDSLLGNQQPAPLRRPDGGRRRRAPHRRDHRRAGGPSAAGCRWVEARAHASMRPGSASR